MMRYFDSHQAHLSISCIYDSLQSISLVNATPINAKREEEDSLIRQWDQNLDDKLMFALFDMLRPSGLSRCCTALDGTFGHQCGRSLSGLPTSYLLLSFSLCPNQPSLTEVCSDISTILLTTKVLYLHDTDWCHAIHNHCGIRPQEGSVSRDHQLRFDQFSWLGSGRGCR